jgi:hypothetical protein
MCVYDGSRLREFIDIRSLNLLSAVEAAVRKPEVVDQKKEDVWLLGSLRGLARCGAKQAHKNRTF